MFSLVIQDINQSPAGKKSIDLHQNQQDNYMLCFSAGLRWFSSRVDQLLYPVMDKDTQLTEYTLAGISHILPATVCLAINA